MAKQTSTAMAPGGQYDQNARVQSSAAAFARGPLRRAVEEAALPAEAEPVVIADYGSATGKNSLAPLGLAIETLRARTSQPVLVFHVDQPANDFSALFSTLLTEPASYLLGQAGVHGCAVGRSFYEPVLPPGLVSVGWSAIAAHWLSRSPAALPGHLWAPTALAPGAELFARQAREDWLCFVRLRAAELRPGGQMVVVLATVDEEGLCGGEHVLDGLDRALRQLVAARALSAEEYDRVVVPNFFLSAGELKAPFAHPELRERAVLLEQVRVIAPDPLWAAFEASGDATALARGFAGWIRAFSQSCLLGALDPERPKDERRQLTDAAYGEVEKEIRRHPEAARSAWRMAALRFRRKP